MFTNLLVNCFVKKTMKAAKVPLIIAHHILAMEQVRVKIVLLYQIIAVILLLVLSPWGRKWQPMEDVKGMWYTE